MFWKDIFKTLDCWGELMGAVVSLGKEKRSLSAGKFEGFWRSGGGEREDVIEISA